MSRIHGESPPDSRGAVGEFDDEEDVSRRTLVALSKLGMALRDQMRETSGPLGVNPTQAQILMVLARLGHTGLRLSTIADQLGVTAPTVSDSVSALESKGLVTRGRDPADGRALAVLATREGLETARALADWPDLLLDSVEVLDDPEKGVLLKALLKVIRALQDRGRISTTRMCVTCLHFRPDAHADPRAPHHCAFVDAAFGDRSLRVDCEDWKEAVRTR